MREPAGALTREALWARLREAALVEGEPPARGDAASPWFVRVMLGFAGWIGALFLLGFVGVGLAFLIKSPGAAWAAGACACAGAAVIFRASRGDFVGQFGLAAALAGQVLMAFGLFDWFKHSGSGVAAALAVQQAVLFVLLPNYIHRVWTAFTAVLAAQFALGQMGLAAFMPATVTGMFLAAWLYEFDHAERGELWRPLGYGLALSAVQAAMLHGALWYGFLGSAGGRSWAGGPGLAWAGAVASSGVLLCAVLALLRREGVPLASGPGKIALAAAAIVAVVSLKAPGVGPAVAILVVGYANGNRVLAGLGIAALVGYLSHYYYSLHATLLEKSGLLVGAGLLLLAARLALHRWWPLRAQEDSHA